MGQDRAEVCAIPSGEGKQQMEQAAENVATSKVRSDQVLCRRNGKQTESVAVVIAGGTPLVVVGWSSNQTGFGA
jgi:hypothetical protein